jgi:phosphoribosyl 1,2-cyclic phosphodiesterase
MPGHIIIQELRDLQFSVGSVPIEATFLNHPGICTGFRLQTTGGPVVYLPDMEPHQRFDAQGRRQTEDHETRAYVESMEQRLVDFARDAEVLIIDAQYDPVEYAGHLGWGHSSLEESVRLGLRAAVKRLFLFHHDPTHDDAKISHMVEAARQLAAAEGSPMIVEGAREGLEVVLHPQAAQGVPLVKAG